MKLLVPPPIQAAICVGLMALVVRYVPELAFSFPYQLYVAGALSLIGISIDLASLRMFYKQQTTVSPISPEKTSQLVVNGIYQYSRNPMYLGLAIILFGIAIWFGNYGSIAIVPCFIWYVTKYQIQPEEEVLLEKFGVEYANYCAQTGRWF